MRHTPHTRRPSMASVENSIDGAAGDASSEQEPIDVEAGSSPSPVLFAIFLFAIFLSKNKARHA